MSKTVCIYHGNCADGFTAAWVVRERWKEDGATDTFGDEPEFIAGIYQRPVPLEKLKGARVIIVDFSYKREVMQQICEVAQSVVWIDHHKSAILDMEGFVWNNFESYTDLARSGAGLTWDYFFPGVPRPYLVSIVEDRDLWKFAYPFTRELQSYIFSYNYSFETWDRLVGEFETIPGLEQAVVAGQGIDRKHLKDINELLPICTRHIRIGGVVVPCANFPYTMVSDAGNILAQRNPTLFGICYYDGFDGRNFSLRSVDGGMDVSEIAKQFGGGGHAKAAGFRVSFEQAKQFEIEALEGVK